MISCYRLKGLRHPIFDYNMDFVRRNTHSNTDPNTQTNSQKKKLPLGAPELWLRTSETIARILQPLQYTCCTQTRNHFTVTAY